MAIPIPENQHIYISKRLISADYCMPSMQIIPNYYNIGYTISGDRFTITTTETYSYHSGDVSLLPPLVYHRTFSLSNTPYESILIKFTSDFVKPFIDTIGENRFKEFYNSRTFSFNNNAKEKIRNIFEDMLLEYNKDNCYKELILQGMLFRLFTVVMEEQISNNNLHKSITPLTKEIIEIISYIGTHYYESPTLSQIAEKVNLSEGYLSRLFHKQLGISYSEYIGNVKIEHAQTLLLKTNKSVMDIAIEIGYCNGDYLSAKFKKNTGMTPTEFRKRYKIGLI